MHKHLILSLLIHSILFYCNKIDAQESTLYTGYTTLQKRAALYQNLTKNIKKDLSYSLKPEYEDKWMNTFATLELLQYTDKFVEGRIQNAFDSIILTSDEFKRSLIQLGYANYPTKFKAQTLKLLNTTNDPEIFSFASEYFIQGANDSIKQVCKNILHTRFEEFIESNKVLKMLSTHLDEMSKTQETLNRITLEELLNNKFLPGEIVLFSFQRKNRDYPGLAIIRNAAGHFIKDSSNDFFHVPLLARSITGMPYYLKYGNTPQGIYKMNGFGVSMSNFIGPSPNVQLQMPVEVSPQVFFKDSTITDSVWNISFIQKLLPGSLKIYAPLYESYNAGLTGRTEIIIHGTTINPDYYFGKPYFPHTPSEGCLTTSELWNGRRIKSNQQLLINGLLKAGGGHGYCIVIDLDNKQQAVQIEEVMSYINDAEKE